MAKKPTPVPTPEPVEEAVAVQAAPAADVPEAEPVAGKPQEEPAPVAEAVADRADLAPTVVVTATQTSFRRIGRQFGREPVSIPAEDLTEAEFAALMAEPLLIVQVVAPPH